jgi:hypothetical protein
MSEVLQEVAAELLPGNEEVCCGLSYAERMIGFGICTLCGILSGSLAILSLFMLNLRKFSVLFTVSVLLFLVALGLLTGWRRILRSFTERNRIIASLCLTGGVLGTLFFGLVKRRIILAIIGFIVEIISFLYFALSFIPGGERLFHLLVF